ncbi:MAG: hypothetical protein SPL61_11605 [Saccharofermentans sp.]|nr:hypothetical protein [Saccharofermentans sp.]
MEAYQMLPLNSSSEEPKILDFLDFLTVSLYNDIVRNARRIRL